MEMLNLENLFSNVKIENDKRLSAEDNSKMEEFKKVLEDMREKFNLYLAFYKENPIKNIDYDEKINNVMGVGDSIYSFEDEFITGVIFKQVNKLIGKVYYYFQNKYNVTLAINYHSNDYYEGRPEQAKENLNYFMSVAIDDVLDDIFNQLGNVSFNDKAINEVKEKVLNDCKSWGDSKKVVVKNGKISIQNFFYYNSWHMSYGQYDVGYESREKIINLFKIINYYNIGDLKNIYFNITNRVNNYRNQYIGVYEVNDTILKSFKTFKNGKIELTFTNGLKALDFAKKYLGYEE